MTQVIGIARDLFFGTKLKTMLQNLPPEDEEGWVGVFARNEADFLAKLALREYTAALIDTQSQFDWESLIRAAREKNIPVLAFGSHMHPGSLVLARKAGAYKSVANSAISSRLGELLAARHKVPDVSNEEFEVEE